MWLRLCIMSVLAACVGLPLLAGYGVLSLTARDMFAQSATGRLEASSASIAKSIDERLAQGVSQLKVWSSLPVMQDVLVADNGGEIARVFESIKANGGDLTSLIATDSRGKVIAATSPTDRGADLALDEGFRTAATGRVFQSSIGHRRAGEPFSIWFSVPILASYDGQSVIGTITAAIDLKTLARSIWMRSSPSTALRSERVVLVVTRRSDGKVAFTSKVDATLLQAVRALGDKHSGVDEIEWKGASQYIASAATAGKGLMQDPGIVVHAIEPGQAVIAAAENAIIYVSIAAVIAAILVLGAAWHLSAPIGGMATAMDRIARGETTEGLPMFSVHHPLSQMARSIEVFRRTRIVRDRLALREQELHRAAKDAEAAALAKAEHLASLSREVRTQLNTIIGLSELINTEVLRAASRLEYAGYAKDIARSGVQLLAVINDLFDLSEAEAGHSRIEDCEADLAEIVSNGVGLMGQAAERAKVELRCEDCDAQYIVRVDIPKMKQILFNLLSNAIKFTPEQGRVTVRLRADADGRPTLTIEDNGIGMPTNLTPIALTPFTTANVPTQGRHGAGLGLPLVKRLVELHGGSVLIESEVGLGTTVTITLPANRLIAAPVQVEERLSA
ncbi:MAG: sensor histidine kinase [Micropepsaceae bacterium]